MGAPVAGVLAAAGPGTVSSDRLESFVPSLVQTASWAAQSPVMGRTTVTAASESGSTVICHRSLRPFTRLALVAEPLVTSRESVPAM